MENTCGLFYFFCRARRGHLHPRRSIILASLDLHESPITPTKSFHLGDHLTVLGHTKQILFSEVLDIADVRDDVFRLDQIVFAGVENDFCSVRPPRRATFDAYSFDTISCHVKGKPQFARAQYDEDEWPFSPCLLPQVRGSCIYRVLYRIHGSQRP